MSNNDDSMRLILLGSSIEDIIYNIKDERLNPLSKEIKERLDRLKSDKVILPLGYFGTSKNMTEVYRESILCYLLGMPNACLPNLMRTLEQAIKKKYTSMRGKSDNMSLVDLINWAGEFLDDIDTAHYFRGLRNRIHSDISIDERDCAEAIRHITHTIETLYPNGAITFQMPCSSCRQLIEHGYPALNAIFIGNTITITCNHCQREHRGNVLVGPQMTRSKN